MVVKNEASKKKIGVNKGFKRENKRVDKGIKGKVKEVVREI